MGPWRAPGGRRSAPVGLLEESGQGIDAQGDKQDMATLRSVPEQRAPDAASAAGVGQAVQKLLRAAYRHRLPVVAAALFAAIFVLRLETARPADAPLVLFVVPIVLCAIAGGPVGGALASLVAIGLTGVWDWQTDAEISALGYGARAVAFSVVGAIVGRYADERRALEQRLDRAYEVALDLQCTAGFDGTFRRVNPAGCALLGFTEEELTARPFVDFVHPDDLERTLRETERLASGAGDTVDFHNRYRTADGSYRWLAWTATGVPADGLIYASARDVTASHDQRDALERLVAERTRDVQAARFEQLRRLALAAEYRDDDTHQHTERVGTLAMLLAERLGLAADFAERIRHAAPLHDVGKLGVPDAILLKSGRLSDDERSLMQTHTTIGATILAGSAFPVLELGEEIALTHHERWDGSGYPHGRAREDIPLAGRIVAVADVFDALTHARPYKAAWPVRDAVDEIVRCGGSQFDPQVVAAFEQLDREGALDSLAQAPGPWEPELLRGAA
jgi:PAS domain S-box-containing protein